MFLFVTLIIAFISVLFAILSLKGQMNMKDMKKARKELAKQRVIFHKDTSL